jgi:Glyoxalase-like domain
MTVKIACITFDCADALTVARFWSAALDRPLDPTHPVTSQASGLLDAATRWAGRK